MRSRRRTERRTERRTSLPVLLLVATSAFGAEAPATGSGALTAPEPLPPEAEAAHLDGVSVEQREIWLDEAVFTEITPVTEPELGIRLPADQDH